MADTTSPGTYFLLTSTGNIAAATEALPNQTSTPVAIAGVTAGETIVAIDVRPQTGMLYGLGVNAIANTATLYTLNPQNGAAIAVGTPSQITFTTNGSTVVDLPDPAAVGYDIDFNPAADRLRVVAGSLNWRVNPNTGAPIDGDNSGLTSGLVTGTNPDGSINAATTTVDGAAYTNSYPNNGNITTLYTIDSSSNSLFIQSPANSGTQTQGQTITLNGSTLDFSANNGFDIGPEVAAPSANTAVTSGSAAAMLSVGGTVGLYKINLVNAQATLIGTLGNLAVRDIAIWSPLPLGIALDSTAPSLIRFRLDSPGTTTTQAIGGVVAGETLVSIDQRPQTGQLYGLGVNATADTATLYLMDPQTGAATTVGTAGQIALVDSSSNPIDLPDPATSGYGFDFNPGVDRIRIVTSTGLNLRVNPNTGAPVDGDANASGVNPDGPINGLPGGSTGVSATAYTNNYSRILGGDNVTTLYTLDDTSNALFIQNPPNNGSETNQLPITLNGAPLDFTTVNGFDIPRGVSVTTSNTPAAGNAYAVLVVGGSTGLYQINLATGAATLLGTVGIGSTALAGFAVWSDSPAALLSASALTVSEGAGSINLTIASTGGGPLVISYLAGGGTATAGSDYTAINGTLVLGTSALTQTISLPIIDDTTPEADETVEVRLLGATGIQQLVTITIVDDEPFVRFSPATYTVSEISSTAALTVTLDHTATTTVTVQYATSDDSATAGSDYTATSDTLTFAPGETSKIINVPILNNAALEPDESFTVTLSAPTNASLGTPSSATVTIKDGLSIKTFLPLIFGSPSQQ